MQRLGFLMRLTIEIALNCIKLHGLVEYVEIWEILT